MTAELRQEISEVLAERAALLDGSNPYPTRWPASDQQNGEWLRALVDENERLETALEILTVHIGQESVDVSLRALVVEGQEQ